MRRVGQSDGILIYPRWGLTESTVLRSGFDYKAALM